MSTPPTADNILQSPILIMAKRAALMRAQGRDVIDLTLGEPDFNAPPHVLEAAHAALSGRLTYSPSNGIEPLRRAIRMRMKEIRNLDYADDQWPSAVAPNKSSTTLFKRPSKVATR